MPTTQKSQQKHTKATQKVGGSSAKKPVTKAMEGGSAKKPAITKAMEGGKGKVVAVKSKATTRGGSAKGGSVKTSTTKPRQHIGGGASKTVRRGPSIKKGGSDEKCFRVTMNEPGTFIVKSCEDSVPRDKPSDEEKLASTNNLGSALGALHLGRTS